MEAGPSRALEHAAGVLGQRGYERARVYGIFRGYDRKGGYEEWAFVDRNGEPRTARVRIVPPKMASVSREYNVTIWKGWIDQEEADAIAKLAP